MKTVVNKATNEQLSVSLNDKMVEIKRTRAPNEKKKNSQNNKDWIEALFDNKNKLQIITAQFLLILL